MGRLNPAYGLINESSESDKLENVGDINIERLRRIVLQLLKNGDNRIFNASLTRLSGNPWDYEQAPGGMKAGLDDDGHIFPQWPDCKPGDWAVDSCFLTLPTPLYSHKYKIPTEVNYKSWPGARQLPNGKYELNGVGHDNWLRTYTPFINAIMNNFSSCKYPVINGTPTYAALGFVVLLILNSGRLAYRPEWVFNVNKLVKHMARKGYFNESVERIKELVPRNQKSMVGSEGFDRIVGSEGDIVGKDKQVIIPAEINIGNGMGDSLKEALCVDDSVISIYSGIEEEFANDLAGMKEASTQRYKDARLESGKVKHTNSGYTILRIDTFEEAQRFSQYCTWCICTSRGSFDDYGMPSGQYSGVVGGGRIYFCLRDDFKSVEMPVDENGNVVMDGNPLDDYGVSMICVSVWADDGSCNTITSRWNHVNGGSDDVMEPDDIEGILGVSFYEAFPGEE